MHNEQIDRMFNGLSFCKSAEEIRAKMVAKAKQIRSKVAERQARVVAMRSEHGIDDVALIQLLTEARRDAKNGVTGKMAYNYFPGSNTFPNAPPGQKPGAREERVIGAGVVSFLLTEGDLIENEKEAADRLELLARNLVEIPTYATGNGVRLPDKGFTVSVSELEYLGF
jgi:hypothetical protein